MCSISSDWLATTASTGVAGSPSGNGGKRGIAKYAHTSGGRNEVGRRPIRHCQSCCVIPCSPINRLCATQKALPRLYPIERLKRFKKKTVQRSVRGQQT